MSDEATVPCTTCGVATRMTGTKKCDNCFEVETRLQDYLRRGGLRAMDTVYSALQKIGDTTVRDAQARAIRFVRNLNPSGKDKVLNDLSNGKLKL